MGAVAASWGGGLTARISVLPAGHFVSTHRRIQFTKTQPGYRGQPMVRS